MSAAYLALGLTILSNVVYHLVQKLTPAAANPMLTLAVSYLVAAATCVALLPLFPLRVGVGVALRQLNGASVALGVAIVGLELGFLLAYRAGWPVSLGPIVTSVAVTLLLLPVGLLVFKDKLTPLNIVGIVVCIVGLWLVNHR